MIKNGEPKLIEYNCRFGDPECQVLMPRLKADLLTALLAARDGVLDAIDLRWQRRGGADRGDGVEWLSRRIRKKARKSAGLDDAAKLPGVQIFHAGTARRDGKIVAAGGRVLDVTATGETVAEAQKRAYAAVDLIDWPQGFCRRDIGWRALKRGTG